MKYENNLFQIVLYIVLYYFLIFFSECFKSVFSIGTTCPECRCKISMLNCRRIYFRYSNDSDSAEAHIEYLNKELLKRTIDLQDERNNKRTVECEFTRQMRDKDYQISKLKQKIKEVQ